jgi:membrane protease YdiL (CAAX protease family)
LKDPRLFPDIFEASFILIILFGIQLLIGNLFYSIIGPFKAGDPFIGGIISLISFGLVISWLMYFKDLNYSDVLNPSKQPPLKLTYKIILPLIFVVIGVFIFEIEVQNVLTSIFPMSPFYEELFSRLEESGAHSIIAVSFIAPFIEEFLFRGIFLRSFLKQYSIRKSILVSSFLFAIFHLNIYQFVIAFVLGSFSGWIYAKTKYLFPCFLIHFLYNSFFIFYLSLKKTYNIFPFNEQMSNIESFVFLIIGAVLIFIGMLPLKKYT